LHPHVTGASGGRNGSLPRRLAGSVWSSLRLCRVAVLAAVLVSLSACVDFGTGLDLLPSPSGWQNLPIRSWLLNDGLGPVTIIYCRPTRCEKPSVIATIEAKGEVARRLEKALASPGTLLAARHVEAATARDPRFRRKPKPSQRASSEKAERVKAGALEGYRVTLAPEIEGGRTAYAVVLAERLAGSIKIAFAISMDPDTAMQGAKTAAQGF
jgi:hypothetical protein